MKRKILDTIEARAADIALVAETVGATPEAGYQEVRTSAFMADRLRQAGVSNLEACAVTGLKGWLPRRPKAGASVALLAELDALKCPTHPGADPRTGMAHACGHHAQLAALYGCALGLGAVRDTLDGDVCVMCAPAEEYGQLGYRKGLMDHGRIAWFGGKQQMIAEGCFEDIDMAMMVHAACEGPPGQTTDTAASLGFIGKQVAFVGRSAHAGAAPWDGVNALNAATLAIQAIHALREGFRDEDMVRVHPVITHGGDSVNTVPDRVEMECYVRAKSTAAMRAVNSRVNRALRGAAHALGARAEIEDFPGYLPIEPCQPLARLFVANAALLLPDMECGMGQMFPASTDMGDLSAVLPAIQPTVTGFAGGLHRADFQPLDPYYAYVFPAIVMAMTVYDLLKDGTRAALAVKRTGRRRTREEYMELWHNVLASPENEEVAGYGR
ncbi:amidohydrolase [Ruminococcaceae bacterium OttesenSCG-928-D13]|nr:amidohydrolase [Ruminococcaceae bacterium OttesenSCG-928-D13]